MIVSGVSRGRLTVKMTCDTCKYMVTDSDGDNTCVVQEIEILVPDRCMCSCWKGEDDA